MIVKELITKLGFQVDNSGKKQYENAIDQIKGFGSKVLGAFAVYEVAQAFHQMAEYAEQVSIATQKLGIGADDVQKLKYAAMQSNVEFETLTSSMAIFSTKLQEAKKGSKEATDSFRNILGGSFNPNSVKDVHKFFLDIADKISKMGSAIEKNAALRSVFGRGGATLLPFFNKGREGIEDLENEGVSLFAVLDDAQLEAGKHFLHNWKSISTFITNSFRQITSSIAPAINSITDSLLDWLKENHDVFKEFFEEVAIVGRVIFDVLGGGLRFAGLLVDKILKGIRWIKKEIGDSLFNLGIFSALAYVILTSFAAIPAILLGIAAIIDDIVSYFEGGKKTVTGLIIAQIEDKLIPAIKKVAENLEDAFLNTKIGKFISQAERLFEILTSISDLNPFHMFGGAQLSTAPAASATSSVIHFNQNVTVNGANKDPKEIADAIKEHGASGMQDFFDSQLRQTMDVFGTSDNSLPLAR